MWCEGEVIEVADGKTTKRSAKCKSTLPWGAVRIKYDGARPEPTPVVAPPTRAPLHRPHASMSPVRV